MDLKRLRDLLYQYETAERTFLEFRNFCQKVYGKKAIDFLGSKNPLVLEAKEERPPDEVVFSAIKQIGKPVFATQDIIQMCANWGHDYNVATIYRALNKLAKEQKLSKNQVIRGGRRAIDWKIEIQLEAVSQGSRLPR